MAKKRKASGEAKPKSRKDDSKLTITTFEDVADEQDEFHLNRDKVLLDEGPAAKRLRKWKEQDDFLQPSDEEVLGYSSDDDEDEDDIEAASDNSAELDEPSLSKHKKRTEDEDEDAGGWGPSKKDYYNADAIETEQDALDEEAEARRIQQKQLLAMTEADFGFDEDEWLGQGDGDQSGNVVTEILPQLQITDDMTEAEKVRILKTRYPEFEFIAKEYLRLQPLHDEMAAAANAAERLVKARAAKSAKSSAITPPTPMAVTKYRACAAYLAAMAMYFAILGSTAKEDGSPTIAMDPSELHEHAVMESLLKCQGLWARVESLPVADPMVEPGNGDELSVVDEDSHVPSAHLKGASSRKKKEKEVRKSKSELAAETAQAVAEARRAEKLRRTEEELTTLASLTDTSALRKAAKQKKKEQPMLNLLNAEDSDFGEETSFTAHELAEKAKKKKSLRFYTSQIVQKANKRDAAGKDKGGDADIPHRERLRDRQARLQAEAEKRGQGLTKKEAPGVTLGEGGESDDDNDRDAKLRGGVSAPDGDDDYYDMIAARGTAKKEAKQELAAAYALAAREGGNVVPQEVVGADGKRKITYMIQKNKGLTPHRSKTVRNPRVKKKLKYEKKKQQLKSMKAVYSGGEARGGYAGELTGIKKGLVRSTKL